MRSFLRVILISVFGIANAAHAENVTGFLVSVPLANVYRLKIPKPKNKTGELLTIDATPEVFLTLSHLRSGSLIVGSGDVNLAEKKVRIDSIQTVGLKELIGAWKSAYSEIFDFRDFNRLMRYVPDSNSKSSDKLRLKLVESLDYVLTPDNADIFSIFITDNQKKMVVGTLRFSSGTERGLILTVYDSETGRESQKISLSPVSLK